MKKLLFGLLISMSLLSACYASDISVEPLLNNVYDAANQSLWVSGASVNGTDISVENLTVNQTSNLLGGATIGGNLTANGTSNLSGGLTVGGNGTSNFTTGYYSVLSESTNDVNWTTSNVQNVNLTVNASNVLTFTGAGNGQRCLLKLNYPNGSNVTVTFPASVRWVSNITPSITNLSNQTDLYSFVYDGTYYIGSQSANYSLY